MKRILFIIFGLLLVSVAFAELTVTEGVQDEICQCDTVTYKFSLTNDQQDHKTFDLYLSGNYADWGSVAPKRIELDPQQSKKVYVFVTPSCYAKPDNYQMTLNAKSGAVHYKDTITMTVKNCHTLDVSSPATKEVCIGDEVSYQISVENTGTFKDSYKIFSDADVNQSDVYVVPGETKTVTVNYKPTQVGEKTLKTEFNNTKVCYSEQVSTKVVTSGCNDFELQTTDVEEICVGSQGHFVLTVENTGRTEDTYEISSQDDLQIARSSIELKPNETQEIGVTYTLMENKNVSLKVVSDSGIQQTVEKELTTKRCSDFMILTSQNNTVCHGDTISYAISVKNKGLFEDTYKLSTDKGALEDSELTVKPNEIAYTNLILENLPLGENEVKITAESETGEKLTQTTTLEVKTCSDVSAITNVEPINVCAGSKASVISELGIMNLGREDTYTVSTVDWITPEEKQISLKENEVYKTVLRIKTPDQVGVYKPVIEVRSNSNVDKAFLVLNVTNCYGFDLIETVDKVDVNLCPGETLKKEIVIKNTAMVEDVFGISTENVEVNKEVLELGPMESEKVELTFSYSNLEDKQSKVTIESKGDETEKSVLTYNVNLNTQNECYCVQLDTVDQLSIQQCTNDVIDLNIENCGLRHDTFTIETSGSAAQWAVVEPKEIELDPSENSTSYMAVRMPIDAEQDSYNIDVKVKGKSQDTETVNITQTYIG